MKIAIDVSQVIFGTGVSIYTRNLVDELVQLVKDEHQLVLFGGSLRRKSELNTWINRLHGVVNRTNYLPPSAASLLWNNFHLLNAETLTGPVDLIHTSDWSEPPSKYPKVTTVHDLNFFRDPAYTVASVRSTHTKRLFWVAKESQKIIAVSQATKQDLMHYLDIDPARIEVIYEGPSITTRTVATDALKSTFHLTKPYFFVPGARHPRKNIKRIVEAMKLSNTGYQLLIAGLPSADEKLLESADVVFGGYLSDRDWAALMSSSEGLIYPSLYEGFGIPILDAFVCGIPVLTSKVSSLPEVAGQAAVIVDPLSVEAISAGIIKLLEDKGALIKEGRQRLTQFSWAKMAKETLRLYESIISN